MRDFDRLLQLLQRNSNSVTLGGEVDLFRRISFIRSVEVLISKEYSSQKFRCPVHLSVGQEAIAVGTSINLSSEDKVISTHRCHAHYLAKGGDLFRMFSELMGTPLGCCKGRGGSMHLFDKSVGFVASIPIVGSSIPIASGLAYAEKKLNSGNIAVSFIGDAALETGAFYETLNLAAVKRLPLLIVLEDNEYSTFADKSVRVPKGRSVEKLVTGSGFKYLSGNGDDVLEVKNLTRAAIQQVRRNIPTLVEFSTYRRFEHCGPNYDDQLKYRSDLEIESYENRDPLRLIANSLISSRVTTKDDLNQQSITIDNYVSVIYQKAIEENLDYFDKFECGSGEN